MTEIINILIADDHKAARGGIWLELSPYPEFRLVGEAKTGEGAIEATLDLRPDVLVLDLMLPDILGHQVAKTLRRSGFNGRILMVSSEDSGPRIEQCFKYGVDGFHWKGGESPLFEAIKTVMAGQLYFDPALRIHLGDLGGLIPNPVVANFAQIATNSFGITEREWQLLKVMQEQPGATYHELAQRLSLSHNTVNSHFKSIFSKLEVNSRIEAMQRAKTLGLL